jgi:hypothetical protein
VDSFSHIHICVNKQISFFNATIVLFFDQNKKTMLSFYYCVFSSLQLTPIFGPATPAQLENRPGNIAGLDGGFFLPLHNP